MADWSAIETALEAWVTALTGLRTHWRGRPRAKGFPASGAQAYCLLSIDGIQTVGNDQLNTVYTPAVPDVGTSVQVSQKGARTFVFGIQIRSSEQRVDQDAKHYASLIRDRVDLPTLTAQALDVADIAFATIIGDAPVATVHDKREMSVHQLDLKMNAIAVADDTPATWIETVKDADLEAPEGTVRSTNTYTVG